MHILPTSLYIISSWMSPGGRGQLPLIFSYFLLFPPLSLCNHHSLGRRAALDGLLVTSCPHLSWHHMDVVAYEAGLFLDVLLTSSPVI